jgi:hypothetical protein
MTFGEHFVGNSMRSYVSGAKLANCYEVEREFQVGVKAIRR